MTDRPPKTLADIEDNLAAVSDGLTRFVEEVRRESDESLRLVVQYTADDYEILYAREDVFEQFAGHELERRVETLVMKGLGDPPEEDALHDSGRLEATLRFYEQTILTHIPHREWSGIALSLDRDSAPVTSLVEEYVGD